MRSTHDNFNEDFVIMGNPFDIQKIHSAYQKFKSYVYYDNFNLHLRYKLAEFENEDLDAKLATIRSSLNQFCMTGSSDEIQKWINNSHYIILPKSFKLSDSGNNNTTFITNKGKTGFIKVDKRTILYDAPIELFIISTLWTINANRYLSISPDSYGYVLPSTKSSRLLFEPYFKNYQQWRDKGIQAAKQQIDQGNNVLFITLDIKNFFHSVSVDFNRLKEDFPSNANRYIHKLTDIIEKICIDHTRKLYPERAESSSWILPLGLPSSGLIANWVLTDFDRDIKNATAPIYYGRYVDDIFVVIPNIEPPVQAQAVEEWLCDRFFKDKKVLEAKGENLLLRSNKCEGLEIQKKKLRLFYFDAHWSLALLNKFQTIIQENSSAFWFLPDEEDLRDSLDDTYDLQYEDTINKFRSISSCKVSKYGASVFLAKRLKLAILSPQSHDKNLTNEIFRFFSGVSIISMYSMWEKVFTYFAITHNNVAIQKLQKLIEREIQNIRIQEETENISLDALKKCLCNHMRYCLMLAQTFVKDPIGLRQEKDTIKEGVQIFKSALLTRHFYLPLPIFALTRAFINNEQNIDELNLADRSEEIDPSILKQNWRVPRHIYLHEICTLLIPHMLRSDLSFYYDEQKNKFIEQSKSIYYQLNRANYYQLNRANLDSVIINNKHKLYSEEKENQRISKIYSEKISINDEKTVDSIKVGISNVNTEENDIQEAITHWSILSREKRKRHIDILNQAERLKVDILLLPEVFVPLNWLCAYADEARRKQRAMIFGLEHFSIQSTCYNLAITILPFEHCKRKEVFIIPRLKNHYSPAERIMIEGNRKAIPQTSYSVYHLYQWRGMQFAVYNCFELTDIVHRSVFRSELDMLFAIEYNKDVNYFSNISESVGRDLHCYYVQANTSYYGDSRVVEPKKTVYQNPVRVKGGDNDVIIRYKLDIKALREFQSQTYILQKDHKTFKPTPPDFQHEKVVNRGKSKQ